MIKLSKFVCPYICNNQVKRTMTHKVFVYGTLKINEPNHHWLTSTNNGNATFIAEGTTKNKYPLVIGTRYNIPFLLYSPGNGHHVKGEVYEVDDKMLSALDELEGHPDYYEREIDNILIKKGDSNEEILEKCWVYFLKKFRSEIMLKQQFESYSSKGPHGLVYMERSSRDPNYDHFPEVKG